MPYTTGRRWKEVTPDRDVCRSDVERGTSGVDMSPVPMSTSHPRTSLVSTSATRDPSAMRNYLPPVYNIFHAEHECTTAGAEGCVWPGFGLRPMRGDQRNGQPPTAPVQAEVAVERDDLGAGTELGHPHQACVGQRHGHRRIPGHQRAQGQQLGVQMEIDLQHAARHQIQHGLRTTARLPHEIRALGEHGLTGEEGRLEPVEGLQRPVVELVPSIEQGHDGPGIDDDVPHFPKPAMCLEAVERSTGPLSEPTSSPAAAAADFPRAPA